MMIGLFAVEALAVSVAVFLSDRRLRNRWPLLLSILTLPALASGALGEIYRVEPGAIAHHNWVAELLTNLCWVAVAAVPVSAILARGFRIWATLFALVQLPICYLVGLGAVMSVTGVYL